MENAGLLEIFILNMAEVAPCKIHNVVSETFATVSQLHVQKVV